ncbi:MAG: hypothetical protein IJ604_13225 [Prevotella sp.]|nr:hypothetical protein [Prevotella sp.]MBR1880492.1 hypothetical protein [Prevotella sp.]
MKYTELIKRFWDMDRNFSTKETYLYLYLLHCCYKRGWPDTFSLSNEELIQRLKCKPTKFRDARNVLVDSGLICYHIGNGRGGVSLYSIVSSDFPKKGCQREHLLDKKGVPKGTPLGEKGVPKGTPFEEKKYDKVQNVTCTKSVEDNSDFPKKGCQREHLLDENSDNTKEKQEKKKTLPPAPPIKEKNKKKKPAHTLLACAHVRENGQLVLFDEEEPTKKKRTSVEQNLPNGMDEVINFFEKNASDKLPDWRAEAELFFYHFQSLGWMGTGNRKIQDWESKAYLWISDKAIKNGEIDSRSLRTYGRTTGLPQEGERDEPQGRGCVAGRKNDTPKDYTKGF